MIYTPQQYRDTLKALCADPRWQRWVGLKVQQELRRGTVARADPPPPQTNVLPTTLRETIATRAVRAVQWLRSMAQA